MAIDLTGLVTQGRALEKKVKDLNTVMIGVVLVLLIGFSTMFISVYSIFISDNGSKQANYQQLEIEIQQLDDKINNLTSVTNKP